MSSNERSLRMTNFARIASVLALFVGSAAGAQQQTVLLDETRTIGNVTTAIQRDFEVPAAGEYELRFTDLQVPAALTNFRVAVTRGAEIVTTLDSPATTRRFNAPAGTYGVRVVGEPAQPAGFATVGLRIVNIANNTAVLDFSDAMQRVAAPPPPTQETLDATFEIAAAGSYQLTLSDLQFPAALNQATAAVVREGAPQVAASLAAPGNTTFDATPGTYRIVAVGTVGSTTGAGLFSVRVRSAGGGAARYVQTVDVGATQRIGSAALSAQAYNLVVSDFAVPAALASVAGIVVADGIAVVSRTNAGSSPFTATAATHEVFGFGAAAGTAGGSYGVEVQQGSTGVIAGSRTVSMGTTGAAYAFTGDVVSPARYTLRLTDFGFLQALLSLRAVVVQGGASLGSLNAGAAPLEVDLQSGRVTVFVFGQVNSGSSGLFGLSLAAGPARPVVEVTQGVGALFEARRIDITSPGRYEAAVTDLGFPASFANLDVQISRGTDAIGSFFAGGSFIFNAASPGSYFVNFVARPGPTGTSNGYGTYRLRVATAAPAPTVTLTAEPSSVTTGSTTRLRWSSTNSTTCVAGNAWTGTKATSGEEVSSALSATSVFRLECVGPGGRTTSEITVNVAPPSSSGGGGGRLSWLWLLVLGAFSAWQVMARTRLVA
jgi:hypothetical protein